MTNKMRGEVEFSEAGDGVVLRLTNADLAGLQTVLGDEWFGKIFSASDKFDFKILTSILKVAPKKDNAQFPVDPNTLSMPLVDIWKKIVDALFLAVHGVTFMEHLEKIAGKMSEEQDKVPPKSPDVSSSI